MAFRIRNDPGSWVGKKGMKVASAAVASGAIDFLLDPDAKKHPLAHIAVSMFQGVVTNNIARGKERPGTELRAGDEQLMVENAIR
ncbi:hypothetical protein ACJZ2D_002111 [Fusarium nematophilum]